jgi:hypothetical protein
VISNGEGGLALDEGIHIVTNNMVARNFGRGVDIYTSSNGSRLEFNTIIDNGQGSVIGAGVQCSFATSNNSMANNIIARNTPEETTGPCSHLMSIIIDNEIAPLKMKQPDSAPYDYHLQAGSIAVDMAGFSNIKVDFDGDARPAGAANDIGADELK